MTRFAYPTNPLTPTIYPIQIITPLYKLNTFGVILPATQGIFYLFRTFRFRDALNSKRLVNHVKIYLYNSYLAYQFGQFLLLQFPHFPTLIKYAPKLSLLVKLSQLPIPESYSLVGKFHYWFYFLLCNLVGDKFLIALKRTGLSYIS